MPLFFQMPITDITRLAVWYIGEDEAFFRNHAVPQREVAHPHKRLQHLAGRFLLRHLFPDFPIELIRIADTRKPFLEDEAYHFSISHCSDYAAAIVSSKLRVGVDIEVITDKAARIRRKFASEKEWEVVNGQWAILHEKDDSCVCSLNTENGKGESSGLKKDLGPDAICATLIWSCKEAVFKWYGKGEVDFKGHIVIQNCKMVKAGYSELQVLFQKEQPEMLMVHSRLLDGLWLSYVAG